MNSKDNKTKRAGVKAFLKKEARPIKKGVLGRTSPPVSGLSSYSTPLWDRVLFCFLLLGGIVSSLEGYNNSATVFLVCETIFAFSFFLPLKKFNQVLVILAAGWLLCLLALGDLPHFQYAFAPLGGFSLPNPVFHFSVGLGLLLAFWRFVPPLNDGDDLSVKNGRIWFWVIFSAAVFLRIQKITEAPGLYWDDPAVCIIDPQGVLNFYEHPMLFPLGQREPFFSYFMAGLWSIFPHAHAILVQRLGGMILDLAAVLVFYFAGKEAGGIRAGLIAEAVAAFSKPLLIENLIGMTAVTVPLAVGLILLTTIRVFKKATWPRFFQWGLALGFAPYNYTPVRPWLPFIVTVVFLWIWFFKLKDRPKTALEFILGWGTVLVWNVLFLKVNNFLPSNVLHYSSLVDVLLAAILFGFFSFCAFRLVYKKALSLKSILPTFFLGVALSAVLIYPLASNPEIAEHTSGLSIFHNQQTRTFDYKNTIPAFMVEKTIVSLAALFTGGQDRGDLNLPWDAFFEFHFVPLFLIGFAAFLSRPSWFTTFLIAAGFVGISTHILSIDPHSAKLVAAVAPLAILCGLGIQQLFSAVSQNNPRHSRWLAWFCVAYLGWAVWGTYDRVWKNYFKIEGIDKIVSREVGALAGQYRTYIATYQDFASPETQTLLDEGREVFLLRDSNPICLRDGESPEDVAVLLQMSDEKARNRIQKEFPRVSWTTVKSNREGTPEVLRIGKIPAGDIPQSPGKLFEIEKVPAASWIRDYFGACYLLYSGLIAEEENVSSPYDPIPPDMGGGIVRISGSFVTPAAGILKLEVTSDNYAILDLDGKSVLNFRPWNIERTASKSLPVTQDRHQVSYLAYLHVGNQIPEIKMSLNGQPEGLLGAPSPLSGPGTGGSAFHLGPPSH